MKIGQEFSFILTPRFITKVELGYDKALIWYSFPLDALAPGGIWGRDGNAITPVLLVKY